MQTFFQTKRKVVVLSLKDKKNLIEAHDRGKTKKQLSKQYNIGASTVPQIINRRNEIMRRCELLKSSNMSTDRKRFTGVEESSFDQQMLAFVRHTQSLGKTLTGSVMQQQAISIHRQIHGETNFFASESWLKTFKRRYGLGGYNLMAKEGSSTQVSTSTAKVGDEDSKEESDPEGATDDEPEKVLLVPKKKPVSKELVDASKMLCEWVKSRPSISNEKYCLLLELKAQIMSEYIDNCDNQL